MTFYLKLDLLNKWINCDLKISFLNMNLVRGGIGTVVEVQHP